MDEIWSYGQMAAWLDEKTSQKLQWLATIVAMNGFFWSSGFYVLFKTDFNVPLLKHTFIFFQPPARFTPGNATSDTTRICDANAPEGKAAILVIVRYLWSSRERLWAYKTAVIYSSLLSPCLKKGRMLNFCVTRGSNNHYQFIIQRNNTKNKYLLMQYTASCWFHASAHYTKSAMTKSKCLRLWYWGALSS